VTVVDLRSGTRHAAGRADFDLHGIVRVRVLDATPDDVAVVERQLGPLHATTEGDPDIEIRFVDRIDDDQPLTYVGYPETGFTDGEFYLLQGKHGTPARTALPFDRVGHHPLVVCERGAGAVPHLLALVNLTALTKDVLPLHASAFLLDGRGVLATGWSKGGKTETLLAFAERGARYVADEWVYLTPDGRMVGVPEPIRLWHWHLRQLPATWSRLGPGGRARLRGLTAAADGSARLGRRLGRGGAGSVLRRAEPVIRRQAYRQVPPHELFAGRTAPTARLDALLLVTSWDRGHVAVEPVDPQLVAARMRASLAEERAAFLAHYRQFRFAFPDRRSTVVDDAERIEERLLHQVLAGAPAHAVRHPYPFELASLVAPVTAALERSATGPASGPAAATGNHGGTS
jgi:hypothetical protein